jgi:hypothetical protein
VLATEIVKQSVCRVDPEPSATPRLPICAVPSAAIESRIDEIVPPATGSMRNVRRATDVALLASSPLLLALQPAESLCSLRFSGAIRVVSHVRPMFDCALTCTCPSLLST